MVSTWSSSTAAALGVSHRCCATTPASSSTSSSTPPSTPGKVRVHISSQMENKELTVDAPVGVTLMEVIRDVARMDMEAACDGTCACSTCHVIFDAESYRKLPSTPSEDEMDMLDLAPAVTKTSRLSCQVQMTPELDGISVVIPDETDNQMR
ncbi:putative mitochondrial ferredoxin 2fe-2s-like protein [Leptomonas pyrrhocoris]|uniref:Putative mitochondrial ferredoxin 2fe-2s-like protein n=1 Tax=Leptomonas pyrrhocoris TaxID=157538 RepID=A0A0N0VD22_LEPPY|nr:putative mitochondrial ferredoxin 2fe-2s-like protein [Leptomonas pyrrhocoris]XP_015652892.1 putative mitochondrial ferredoxin 2fe-2s-like protein [Leptomonas pyrrhocoris]XP_015652893.1 putative mitochondrial ferredoxin 2fe-2s-like protein [Leptomonas pyrrhocoris]KPA74452.1 putative mitochondrial ferredoxin 2fe-2s-like protein [Leptomonas pyrrhocoris]KPA74453.1 putative mitochondrial ferredoxin 2fe-2s-like protein [Leptomonas pyrrhocoris]KPA74454.1 putative mitochondrial ferredoxin 2fe-2s-l|eukprot:XP_015652891.1 putative mitochondrial ferredoxin 2fe-2s-like protein [Leptomonas pyrrhocoris]